MAEQDRKRLAVAVGALGEAFGRPVTTVTIRAYEIGLRGLSIADIERAVNIAIAERKFMPVPSELRELAGEMRVEDRAVVAWSIVESAMRRLGGGRTVLFDDPATNATIANLWRTWTAFEEALDRDEEKWLRKDFERVYCALLRSGVGPNGFLPLAGENDLHGSPYMVSLAVERGWKEPEVARVTCGLPALSRLGSVQQPTKRLPHGDQKLLESIGVIPEEAVQ